MEGATPVVQLSNNAQMKMVKVCTMCGAEGHCAQDCTGAAASAPASSSGDPHGASPAEPAGSMPPPAALPPSYTDAQIRYSEEHGGGLGSAGAAPRRSYVHAGYVRYHAGRSAAAAKGEEKGTSSFAPEPDVSEVPEVPDVPASAYGNGTYDAYHAARRAERAEVGAKGKSKKGKSKKGKDSSSSQSRNQTGWWNRDLWSYERS